MFDGLFLADVLGVYDVYRGSPDAAIRERGADPGQRSAAAGPGDGLRHPAPRLRRHLQPDLRAAVYVRPPHVDARSPDQRAHRLEHRHRLSRQRRHAAWGLRAQPEHDSRYDIAEEYMQVVYKLWEGSWEDDAVLRDRATRHLRRPGARCIGSARRRALPGDAIHLSRALAAAHAGAVPGGRLGRAGAIRRAARRMRLRQRPVPPATCARSSPTSARARRRSGRDPADIKIFVGATVVGRADRRRGAGQARGLSRATPARRARWRTTRPRSASTSRATGRTSRSATSRTTLSFQSGRDHRAQPRHRMDAAKLLQMMVLGSRQAPIVGSPAGRGRLSAWVDEADVDGFNLSRTVMPECVEDFIALVVPELQARGVMKQAYAPGTLRQKLFVEAARLRRATLRRITGAEYSPESCEPDHRYRPIDRAMNTVVRRCCPNTRAGRLGPRPRSTRTFPMARPFPTAGPLFRAGSPVINHKSSYQSRHDVRAAVDVDRATGDAPARAASRGTHRRIRHP